MELVTQCSQCKVALNPEDVYCPNCGFPERAEESEKGKYIYRIQLKKNVITDAKKKLKNVRILLWIVIVLNIISGIFLLFNNIVELAIGSLISAAIYIGCLIWVGKQPLIGIMAAFIFWILMESISMFSDPNLIFKGIILKVIFVIIFIKGIKSAKDYQNYSSQLKNLKAN